MYTENKMGQCYLKILMIYSGIICPDETHTGGPDGLSSGPVIVMKCIIFRSHVSVYAYRGSLCLHAHSCRSYESFATHRV